MVAVDVLKKQSQKTIDKKSDKTVIIINDDPQKDIFTCEQILWNETSLGMTAKIQRICRKQSKQDVADIASVSVRDVDYFESNLPLRSNVVRRLLRAYDLIVESESEKNSVA